MFKQPVELSLLAANESILPDTGEREGNTETKGNEVIWGHGEFDNLVEYPGGDMQRAVRNTVLEHQKKGDIKAGDINWEGHQHRGGNLSTR